MATIHTFTGNEVIATEVPNYLNQNFSNINTEVTTLSANAVKTVNGKKATNNNINVSEFDSYWKASETVTVGDVRFLGGRENSGIVLECVKTGTTGSTQPTVSDYVGMGGSGGEIEAVLSAIETVQTQVNAVNSSMSGISDYIIESYQSGTSWYRKWKSGWVEQGGVINTTSNEYSTTFLKPFSALPSLLIASVTTETFFRNGAVMVHHLTTTGFYKQNVSSTDAQQFRWEARGQGA